MERLDRLLLPAPAALLAGGVQLAPAGWMPAGRRAPPHPATPTPHAPPHPAPTHRSSWSSFFSNTLVTFLCAPLVGELSDRWGRRPFIIAALCLALLPMGALMLHLRAGVALLWWVERLPAWCACWGCCCRCHCLAVAAAAGSWRCCTAAVPVAPDSSVLRLRGPCEPSPQVPTLPAPSLPPPLPTPSRYYPCQVLGSAISSSALFLAYVADLLPGEHRTTGFGLIMASFSLGFMAGPLVGGFAGPLPAAYTCLGCICCTVVHQ